jgi:spermidine synthase
MVEREEWLASNRRAIERRVQWLQGKADGVLSVEPAGPHFAVVTKRGSHLRLVLAEQVRPQSDLTQSSMDLQNPLHLVSPYTQAAVLGLAWVQEVRRVYAIGLGGGRVPLVLHHYLPEAIVDCAEIDPVVVTVAEKYFGLRQDERLRVALADGREWLARPEGRGPYDLIFLDAFLDKGYTPYRLATRQFYQLCSDRLGEEGVLVVNLMATDRFHGHKVRTLQSVFPQVCYCPAGGDNRVFFASHRRPWEGETLLERVAALQDYHGFSFSLVQLAARIVLEIDEEALGLGWAQVLTDEDPPEGYFDLLPSFDLPFGRIDPELPCPCGSGVRFAACHGRGYAGRSGGDHGGGSEGVGNASVPAREVPSTSLPTGEGLASLGE